MNIKPGILSMAVRSATAMLATLLVSGCAQLASKPNDTANIEQAAPPVETSDTAATAAKPALPKGNFSQQELFELLTAEFAGQRQQFDVARQGYLYQAQQSGNPQIAFRAMQVAQFTGDIDSAIKAADIWLQAEPDNADAHWSLAQLYMSRQQFSLALDEINAVHQLSGVSHYELLASTAAVASEDKRNDLQEALLQQTGEDPSNASVWTALGIINQSLGMDGVALRQYEQALTLQPDLLSAAVFKARLLANGEDKTAALAWVEQVLTLHPEHKGMKVLRARLILNQGDMAAALQAFEQLYQEYPDDNTLLLSLALIEYDMEQDDNARQHLQELLSNGAHRTQALYYLGQLEQRAGEQKKALTYYIQVTGGREFMPAQLSAAQIIADQDGLSAAINYLGKIANLNPQKADELTQLQASLLSDGGEYDAAMERYNFLLDKHPNDPQILYSRAMLADRMGNLDMLEADLRQVIELQPDNAEAMNALGYTLVDRLGRSEEALPMLQKAAELRPDSPAVLDSLGWAYFHLQQYDQAEPLLKQAFDIVHDHEIAAHYGEVLWKLGKQSKARQAWKAGLKSEANSPILLDTLKRHGLNADDL
ncbi:tetratricopeptide repeat protein [Oceanobacter mangrovi]|uniref:tetratricopeptide repeat protein n=1 Tax=Oceanobacter mangrovi TaxID=2862510 RepID=UPI001C8D50D0|nr:tetratricopeptide repeat protein [Oceanobacter mangrovi]